ncbi:MAG: DUF1194 domain-containing protein, partial [Rhodospirillaceae bacterium]
AKMEVDLQLALGSDVSFSVDREEARLQRNGYVAAFREPAVLQAIKRGRLGRIAVMYFEWGGYQDIHLAANWTVIKDKQSIEAFARRLEAVGRLNSLLTSISSAIEFSVAQTDANNFTSRRKVIDLSGDGPNNIGNLVTVTRDVAVARGFTINGLPIINGRPTFAGFPQMKNLDLYYRDCVIGGDRAFHVVANNFEDFGRAIIRKLILEIAELTPPRPLLRYAAARASPPCDIGEQLFRKRWGIREEDWNPIPEQDPDTPLRQPGVPRP